jgi:hypothetical protein
VRGDPLRWAIGDRLSPRVYAVAAAGRLYFTEDDGRTWTLANPEPARTQFLVSPADPERLYAGGPLACPLPSGTAALGLGLEPDPAAGDLPEPAAPLPFARSQDGGATWAETESEPATDAFLQPLLAHPTEPLTVLAAGCMGLYITYDGGDVWELHTLAGTEGLPAHHVVRQMVAAYAAVAPNHPAWDALYAAAYDAGGDALLLFSDDEGRSWETISPLVSASGRTQALPITALAADPAAVGRLWFAAGDAVWATEDLGQFWGLSRRGLPAGAALHALLHHPRERLLLGTAAGLYIKDPAIVRWRPLEDGLPGALAVEGVLFTDAAPNHLWLNTPDGVYRYTLRDW